MVAEARAGESQLFEELRGEMAGEPRRYCCYVSKYGFTLTANGRRVRLPGVFQIGD
jgi:hypothetical protein